MLLTSFAATVDSALSGASSIDVLAIILALVSLALTGVGFFASLHFYREGSRLQSSASDTLVKLTERADSIQRQTDLILNKTLDSALKNSQVVTTEFGELFSQLTEIRKSLDETPANKSVAAKTRNEIETRLLALEQQLTATQETALDIARHPLRQHQAPDEASILALLSQSKKTMTIDEIMTNLASEDRAAIHRTLRHMSDKGSILRSNVNGVLFYAAPNGPQD